MLVDILPETENNKYLLQIKVQKMEKSSNESLSSFFSYYMDLYLNPNSSLHRAVPYIMEYKNQGYYGKSRNNICENGENAIDNPFDCINMKNPADPVHIVKKKNIAVNCIMTIADCFIIYLTNFTTSDINNFLYILYKEKENRNDDKEQEEVINTFKHKGKK